jgi:hypothetical protein
MAGGRCICNGPSAPDLPCRTPQQRGFGSTLLDRVLAMQANAKVQITFDTEGLTFRMEAPLSSTGSCPSIDRA